MRIIERNKVLVIDGYHEGKRVRISTGLKLDGVNDIRIRGLAQVKLGEYIVSLGAAAAGEGKVHDWLRKNKTKQRNKYLELVPAHYVWSNLNKEFVQELVMQWEDEGKRSSTVNCYVDEILAMIRKAAKEGLCSPPKWVRTDVVSSPRGSAVRRVTLGDEEVAKIWDTKELSNYDIRAAFLFSIYTGLRWSDLKKLKWIELESSTVDKLQIKTLDQVVVKLGKMALKALSGLTRTSEYVFNLPTHGHAWELVGKLGRAAGIEKQISWHIARHTYATRMINNGVEIFDVSKLLGHRSIKTTMVYAQISGKKLNQAIDLIDY